MTNNTKLQSNYEVFRPPCHDCIKAEVGANGEPRMCIRVANTILDVLRHEFLLDTSSDMRSDAVIAQAYVGEHDAISTVARGACIQLSLPRPLAEIGILEKIQG